MSIKTDYQLVVSFAQNDRTKEVLSIYSPDLQRYFQDRFPSLAKIASCTQWILIDLAKNPWEETASSTTKKILSRNLTELKEEAKVAYKAGFYTEPYYSVEEMIEDPSKFKEYREYLLSCHENPWEGMYV